MEQVDRKKSIIQLVTLSKQYFFLGRKLSNETLTAEKEVQLFGHFQDQELKSGNLNKKNGQLHNYLNKPNKITFIFMFLAQQKKMLKLKKIDRNSSSSIEPGFFKDPDGELPFPVDSSSQNDSYILFPKKPKNDSTDDCPQYPSEGQIISHPKKRRKRKNQFQKLGHDSKEPEVLDLKEEKNRKPLKKISKKPKNKSKLLAQGAKGIFCLSKEHKNKIEQNFLNLIITQAISNSHCDDSEVNEYQEFALKKVTKKNNLEKLFHNDDHQFPEGVKNRAFDHFTRAIDEQISNRKSILRKLIFQIKIAKEQNRITYLRQLYVYKLRLRHEILVRKTRSQ